MLLIKEVVNLNYKTKILKPYNNKQTNQMKETRLDPYLKQTK